MNKKILIGSIIAVVILLLPSNIAMSELGSDDVDVIKIQNTGSGGQPDLIITDIWFGPGWHPYVNEIGFTVENIGDAKVPDGQWIEGNIVVYRLHLGIIPVYYKTHNVVWSSFTGLGPGQSKEVGFGDDDEYPAFGFFRFYGDVYTAGESDYRNNDRKETMFTIVVFPSMVHAWFELW